MSALGDGGTSFAPPRDTSDEECKVEAAAAIRALEVGLQHARDDEVQQLRQENEQTHQLMNDVLDGLWRAWNDDGGGNDWNDLGNELFRRGLAERIGWTQPTEADDEGNSDEDEE